jgi:lysophospholipase L1-like esterase
MARLLKGLLFRILPALVIFGLLEAGLRATDLPGFDACWVQKEEFWEPEPDPELGWTYRPGSVVAKAEINAMGLRGPVLAPEKPPGSIRILFIGDSTCFGLGVRLEQSFADRAARAIQASHPDRRVEYGIGAIPGYSSHHSRVLLGRLLPLRPDLVVFYVGARNDPTRLRYYADGDIPARLARRHARWHQVRILRLAENWADYLDRTWWRKLRSEERNARVPPAQFRENMQAMLAATRAAGAKALVLQPPYAREFLADHPIIPEYQAILEETARRFGVPSVALQPRFLAYDEAELYAKDGFHFRKLGHAVTAEAIHETVEAAGLLDGSG